MNTLPNQPLAIRLNGLRNAEWLSFHTEFLTALEAGPGCTAIGINDSLWTTYKNEYANAQTSLNIERASILTQQIANADHARDQAYRDLHNATLAYQHHPDSDKRHAAQRILQLFKTEGNLARNTYSAESSHIEEIDTAFTTTLKTEVALLQLASWHQNLAAAHQTFLTLWRLRTGETAAQTELRMTQERPKLDRLYHHILGAVQAQTYVSPAMHAQSSIDFIHHLNVIIAKYKAILTRRAGASADDSATSRQLAAPPSAALPLEVLPPLELAAKSQSGGN